MEPSVGRSRVDLAVDIPLVVRRDVWYLTSAIRESTVGFNATPVLGARMMRVTLVVLFVVILAAPSTPAAMATSSHIHHCGRHDLGRLRGLVIARGVKCATAERILRRFSLHARPARGWHCYRGASLWPGLPAVGGAGCARGQHGREVAEVVFVE